MDPVLVRLANECSTAPRFEAAVLDLLQRTVGFDVAFFSIKGAEASPAVVGLDAGIIERAVRGGSRYAVELEPVKRAALQARGVAVDTRVLGERAVRRQAYHREVARSVNGRHSLMAYVPLRSEIVAGIMLGRCGTSSEFSDAEMARVEALLPALGVARGSFGLPPARTPLPAPPAPSNLLGRLGAWRRPHVLATERIGEATIVVRDVDGYREMVASENGSELVWTRASLHDASESGWPYVELLHLAALQAKAHRRALFVGSGGAVALRQFARTYPGLAIDLVEREPKVIELARAWFGLDAIPGVSVHIADGARFVRHAAPASWDVAVIDAIDAAAPSDMGEASGALQSAPFFASLHRALAPGGTLAVNVIGTLDGHGPVRDVTARLARAFERVRVVPVMEADERYSPSALRNVVLIASRRQ